MVYTADDGGLCRGGKCNKKIDAVSHPAKIVVQQNLVVESLP